MTRRRDHPVELTSPAKRDLKRLRAHAARILRDLTVLETDPFAGEGKAESLQGLRAVAFWLPGGGYRAACITTGHVTRRSLLVEADLLFRGSSTPERGVSGLRGEPTGLLGPQPPQRTGTPCWYGESRSEGLHEMRCCSSHASGVTRRQFLQGTSGVAAAALAATSASAARDEDERTDWGEYVIRGARSLTVLPVLIHDLPEPVELTSWRSWGGVQTEEMANEEVARITNELERLARKADFAIDLLPVARILGAGDVVSIPRKERADVVIIYAAGGGMDTFDALAGLGKPVIFFIRHKSGPYYLWHEIVSARYLRQHTDGVAKENVGPRDVVVDDTDELLWRLRGIYGLRNTMGRRILAVGGPGGWATGAAPDLARERFELDMQTVAYPDLQGLIKSRRAQPAAMKRARLDAAEYLDDGKLELGTEEDLVVNAFVLAEAFRELMDQAEAEAITVNGCMGQIMPVAEAAPCLTLSLLNDMGYMAYCESDFVVIPSGILTHYISGKPSFFCNPTWPHAGHTVFAHCTAPRRMDGKRLEPVKVITHFESDLGPAPKVEMRKDEVMTFVMPNFQANHWSGLLCRVVDNPFLPICRSQVEVEIMGDWEAYTENQEGFHHMGVYGDYRRETGYAVAKAGLGWTDYGA